MNHPTHPPKYNLSPILLAFFPLLKASHIYAQSIPL